MIESSLHREWVSILSECVYAKFHPIDLLRTSHDIAKKQPFFDKYWQTYTTLRGAGESEGERFINC